MKKRLFCLILVLSLLLSGIPLSVNAQDTAGSVYITVRTCLPDPYGITVSRDRIVHALEDGNDLLISARDLAEFCGFALDYPDENTVTFTRGYKVVSVDLTTSRVRFYSSMDPDMCSNATVELPSQVVNHNGQYYLSAAGMLPRLNVNCSLNDGLLTILPSPVSLWDFLYDIDLSDYFFDIAYCAQVLDCSQKHIQALAYSRFDLSDSVICGIDAEFADTREFYAILDRFMQDETASDQAIAQLSESCGVVAELAGNYEEVFEWIDLICPGSAETFQADFVGDVGKPFEITHKVTRFMAYCNLFNQDNSRKIAMMDSFINNYGYEYNEELIDAARQVKMSYEDFWLGLLFKGGYDFIYELTDTITFESIREFLGVNFMNQLPDNELLEQTPYFEGLMDATKLVYNKQFDPNSRRQISDWYSHAFLYFYSVEQIYWGMAQHVLDMDGGQYDDFQSFQQTAASMEHMYGQYLAASLYINNDLFDNSFFQAKSQEFLASFPHVTRMRVPGTASSAAEYAIYLSAIWEMGLGSVDWTVADIDNDGSEELFITYIDSTTHVVVLDDWTMEHLEVFFSAYDTFQCLQARDGRFFLRHDYDDGEYAYTTFYTWDGQKWTESAQWRNFANWDSENWADNFYDDFFLVDGMDATESEYNTRIAPFLSGGEISFNYMDSAERTLTGDALAMMEELSEHFHSRENCIKSLQIDVNNDLYMDRVWLLCDAVNMWTDLQDPYLELYGPSPMHTFRDRMVTLVLAENYGTELRLRVQRLNLPYMEAPDLLGDAKAVDTALEIGNEIFYYQEYSEPFSTYPMFGGTPTDRLIGMTRSQVKATLKDYEEWIGCDGGTAQGYLDGRLVQVEYASPFEESEGEDVVFIAFGMEMYPSPYSICPDLEMDMDVFTIYRTIYPGETLSTRWTPVKWVEDGDGNELCLSTCYYMHIPSGNMYKITMIYPDGDGHVAPFAFYAEYIAPEDVPDSVWESLADT